MVDQAALDDGPNWFPGEPDDVFASYSNYGSVIDIAAPGT